LNDGVAGACWKSTVDLERDGAMTGAVLSSWLGRWNKAMQGTGGEDPLESDDGTFRMGCNVLSNGSGRIMLHLDRQGLNIRCRSFRLAQTKRRYRYKVNDGWATARCGAVEGNALAKIRCFCFLLGTLEAVSILRCFVGRQPLDRVVDSGDLSFSAIVAGPREKFRYVGARRKVGSRIVLVPSGVDA